MNNYNVQTSLGVLTYPNTFELVQGCNCYVPLVYWNEAKEYFIKILDFRYSEFSLDYQSDPYLVSTGLLYWLAKHGNKSKKPLIKSLRIVGIYGSNLDKKVLEQEKNKRGFSNLIFDDSPLPDYKKFYRKFCKRRKLRHNGQDQESCGANTKGIIF